jgi:phage/plasmid-associated DNA primase
MTSQPEQDVRQALDIARQLAAMGVPIFAAPPDPSRPVGFRLPSGWQRITAAEAQDALDTWRPGWALCAVMGHGLDLVDVDTRSGGSWPEFVPVTAALGIAATPSGGLHGFVPSLGLRSRDAILPGVDYKGGTGGDGHGFAFIAPTVKPSKVTGQPAPYVWITPPSAPADHAEAVRNWQALGPLRQHIGLLQASSPAAKQAAPGDIFAEFYGQQEAQSRQTAARACAKAVADASMPAAPGQGYRLRLMKAAMILGGYVGAGALSSDVAWSELAEAVRRAWGTEPDDDDMLWIQQGLDDGAQRPFHVYDERAADPLTGLPPAAAQSLEHVRRHGALPEVFDPSDAGSNEQQLAERVLGFLHPNLRMDSESGAWLVRGSDRWHVISRDAATWAIAEVAPRMPVGLRPVPKDPSEREPEHWQAHRHAVFHSARGSSGIANKIRAVLATQGHTSHVRLSELDAQPEILWAGGQAWDLRTGQLADIDPLTPHTHAARVTPVEGPTPLWDAFTEAVWPDAEIREWALTVLSVGLTGHSSRVMPVLYGETGRGKSQVVMLISDLLGTYGGPADQKLIIAPEAHGSVVYSLKGLRLAFIDEPAPTHRDKVERVKLLTGGGTLTGNMMRKDPVTWKPTHTLVLMQNDAPELIDDALRDRARVVLCDGDPDRVSRTRAAIGGVDGPAWAQEAPGVMAAMVARAGRVLGNPGVLAHSATPASIGEAVDAMVREQDPIRQWMEARTSPADPGTKARELHDDFAQWFKISPVFGRRGVPSMIEFGRRLTKIGVGTTERRDGKYRHLQLNGPANGWVIPPMPASSAGFEPLVADVTDDVADAEGGSATSKSQVNPYVDHDVTDVTDSPQFLSQHHNYIDTVNNSGYTTQAPLSVTSATDVALTSANEVEGSVTPPGTALAVPEPSEVAPKRRKASLTSAYAELRKAEKAARVTELAGPIVELPALVQRTAPTPRHIGHVHVGPRLDDLVAKARGCLTVDVENSGFPIGHPDHELRTVQLGTRVAAFDLDASCSECREIVRRQVAKARVLHAHNAAADLSELAHAELGDLAEMWGRMDDTVLRAKLADPTSTGGAPGLKDASAAVLGDQAMSPAADDAREALFKAAGWLTNVDPTDPAEKSGWLQVNPRCSTMISYACADVLDGALLALDLPEPDPEVHARERAVQTIVSRPAALGFPLDRAAVLEQNELHENAVDTLLRRVRAELGIDNPGSPKQVGERLLALGAQLPATATGKPSVAKDVLQAMAGAWELPDGSEDVTALEPHNLAQHAARMILDWRKHDTVLKLILRPWKIATTHGDGRIRPTVYSLGADTGRMSCVRPNMQQVSKKGGVRECIAADGGMSIISADFAGVELRVAAALSGDRMLRHAIDNGLDIHRMIAAQVFGEDYADANRTLAKRIVFGRIYGGGIPTLAKQAGVSQAIAAAAVEVMDSITPDLAIWSEQIRSGIRAGHRQFRTYSGRVIHLDPKLPHKGPNYLIQGSARELLVDALLRWERGPWGGGLVMPVHDEVVAMVPEHQADDALAHLLECMTLELNGIPIAAEAGGPPARTWHSG